MTIHGISALITTEKPILGTDQGWMRNSAILQGLCARNPAAGKLPKIPFRRKVTQDFPA
jgi:hypothetical protein